MLQKEVTDKKESDEQETPLFSVGLIADPQYADADNGQNYMKTRTRRYRQALTITKNAVTTWNDETKCIQKMRPSLIMCLGDVIDLLNVKKKESIKSMNAIMMEFDKFNPFNPDQLLKCMNLEKEQTKESESNKSQKDDTESKQNEDEKEVPFGKNAKYPFYHNCLGNHEVYNFDRKQCSKYQYLANYDKENDEYIYYYSFSPFKGFKFIVLDAFVLSVHGYEYCDNKHKYFDAATELLNKYNPAENKNIPPTPTDKTEVDVARYTAFNGAFGDQQLKWLENELEIATKENDKVFIFSHVPLISENNPKFPYEILAWDYKECKTIIDKYKNVVKAFMAGHDHDGDLKVNGIVHRTLEGVIESDENTDCFATLYLYNDKFVIKGYGKIKDETYKY